MKNLLFGILIYFIVVPVCYSQKSEVHFGVTTVGTTVDNLLRLDTLSLKEFRSELELLGYSYYGVESNGISMIKGTSTRQNITSGIIVVEIIIGFIGNRLIMQIS